MFKKSIVLSLLAMLCVSVNAQERPRQDKFENYVNECTKFFKPDGEACWKAGIVLDERAGAGVKTENEKETIVTEARRFYKKGCDLNFARACNGFVRYNKISNENKIIYLNKGIELGSPVCISAFAGYELKNGNKQKAKELWKQACEKNFGDACFHLSFELFKESNNKDLSYEWFKPIKDLLSAGCEKGSARSCLMLYVDSNDVKYLNRSNDLCYSDVNCSEKPTTSITQFLIKEGQLTAASKLAKFGCDHLYAESCRRYAEMCEVGQGTRKNKDLAKQFYGKACDLGDNDGCEGFARLQE